MDSERVILAIESPFYGKNAQVVLKLGRAQGAAMIAALEGIGFHLQKHVADDVSHGHQGAEEPGLGVAQDATEVEEEST